MCHIGAGALRGLPHRQRCSVPAVADVPAVECDTVEAVAVQSPGPDGSSPRCLRTGLGGPSLRLLLCHATGHHCFTAAAPLACTWWSHARRFAWPRDQCGWLSRAWKAPSGEVALLSESPGQGGRRLVLVDAFAVLYRAHHGFKPEQRLRNSAGVDTSVIFGFLKAPSPPKSPSPPEPLRPRAPARNSMRRNPTSAPGTIFRQLEM